MAIFLMGVMTVVFLLSTFIMVFLLNYKQGKLVKKKWAFITISVIVLLGLLMNLTALPSNYLIQRLVFMVMIVIAIGNVFLYETKFNVSRAILSFIALISLLLY